MRALQVKTEQKKGEMDIPPFSICLCQALEAEGDRSTECGGVSSRDSTYSSVFVVRSIILCSCTCSHRCSNHDAFSRFLVDTSIQGGTTAKIIGNTKLNQSGLDRTTAISSNFHTLTVSKNGIILGSCIILEG